MKEEGEYETIQVIVAVGDFGKKVQMLGWEIHHQRKNGQQKHHYTDRVTVACDNFYG